MVGAVLIGQLGVGIELTVEAVAPEAAKARPGSACESCGWAGLGKRPFGEQGLCRAAHGQGEWSPGPGGHLKGIWADRERDSEHHERSGRALFLTAART